MAFGPLSCAAVLLLDISLEGSSHSGVASTSLTRDVLPEEYQTAARMDEGGVMGGVERRERGPD